MVTGNGTSTSSSYPTLETGTYRWAVSYSGDTDNPGVPATCGGSGQTSTTTIANPAVSASAPDAGAVGETLFDVTTVAGGFRPGGTPP